MSELLLKYVVMLEADARALVILGFIQTVCILIKFVYWFEKKK